MNRWPANVYCSLLRKGLVCRSAVNRPPAAVGRGWVGPRGRTAATIFCCDTPEVRVVQFLVVAVVAITSACTTTQTSETTAPLSGPVRSIIAAQPAARGRPVATTVGSAPEPTIRGGVPVRVIATDATGSARVQATPFALRERALPTVDLLVPPPDDGIFRSTVLAVDDATLARTTWHEDCPVDQEELASITVSFIGFDDEPHTGELIVHADYAEQIAAIFGELFEQRFPIEEMRIVEPGDLIPPHLGDTNNTSSFVCRRVTGGSRFSEHASGLAIDINPFHNPYVKGRSVIPALSGSFGDRAWQRQGMIEADNPVVDAFRRIGWKWGGEWNSLKDYQHFSHNGR